MNSKLTSIIRLLSQRANNIDAVKDPLLTMSHCATQASLNAFSVYKDFGLVLFLIIFFGEAKCKDFVTGNHSFFI